jgi:DNA-binding NarL/FixJ family response regulator
VSAGELWADRAATHRLVTALLGQPKKSPNVEELKIGTLTARERHIVSVIGSTSTSSLKELANHLGITERTLRNHLSSVYQKLGVSGRLELYIYAKKYGLDR